MSIGENTCTLVIIGIINVIVRTHSTRDSPNIEKPNYVEKDPQKKYPVTIGYVEHTVRGSTTMGTAWSKSRARFHHKGYPLWFH